MGGGLAALIAVIYAFVRSQRTAETERIENEQETARRRQLAASRMSEIFAELKADPGSKSVHRELIQIATAFQDFSSLIYDEALNAVESSPELSSPKQLALRIGRISYGGKREDGLPTTYDEQAIRNDISSRTDAM